MSNIGFVETVVPVRAEVYRGDIPSKQEVRRARGYVPTVEERRVVGKHVEIQKPDWKQMRRHSSNTFGNGAVRSVPLAVDVQGGMRSVHHSNVRTKRDAMLLVPVVQRIQQRVEAFSSSGLGLSLSTASIILTVGLSPLVL